MDETPEKIRDYRDLIVWQEAMDIAESVYALTRGFPREEMFGLAAQMRRCAASIPANIAEGFGRAQRRPFIQFLRIAQGSLKELETHTMLCGRVGLLSKEQVATMEPGYTRLGKRLVSFVRSLDGERE
ncbi:MULTISPECIES: four helix bundle protein [unclassified Mesorhizobium]|uniref:four helix bundle protein n=1 Tax=unclassified Mesorhizobium TaxID=325217 RepID=UPI000BB0648C|nr:MULTISPECIES: four helix bundle protein [unclassified Mesorhizobium]TGT58851.1 four helix bundle protein [Mesorhizobium sp. M00.F.Ca.ET.170.01.1.1]AZO12322.1 four helix bundle protein [Mesorhizobium sp. M3A.F.Ca.ET.080.04.2.1]PBB83463.1 four helix bundle protein [Mesorhizobium sp. WSM3876]RWB75037.1 MAG: four helix bundle protein [Mesorhizobium sp.]RWB89501.1 MAG: four helix bundle protein [Mesorhizobium sp.]